VTVESLLYRFIRPLAIAVILAGCIPNTPTPSPVATPIVSPLIAPVPISQRSKLSVHIGNRPQGFDDFLEVANPTVVYSLNNSPDAEIHDHSPHTILVRRIQNSTWNRLPDAMYQGLFDADWEEQARASARYEILGKLIYVPQRGYLNYIGFVKLAQQDFVAPINEPVFGQNYGDYAYKARWLDAWFQEWLTIAHANGLRGSIYSFPTGEPIVEAVPYLIGSARMAAQWGDIIDVHEYGIEGPLMSSPSSGAFGFARFYEALPTDARPMFMVSEFGGGNGYDTGISGEAWIADSMAYGLRLRDYPYLLGACAFQLDLGAESNIPQDVLENYAHAAAAVDWAVYLYRIYLPMVTG